MSPDLGDVLLKGALHGMLPILLPFIALVIVWALFKTYLYRLKLNKLSKAGIDDIDKMDGKTFEQYLEAIFARKGYSVQRTPYRGDFGGDLVIAKNGRKTVVQAKRWKRKVGVKAVQEAVAARGYYDCADARVISNSDFTSQATELANKNNVELWGRQKLFKEFIAFAEPPSVRGSARPETNKKVACSKCGKEMSPKESSYCKKFRDKFKGKLYCYNCQRSGNLAANSAN